MKRILLNVAMGSCTAIFCSAIISACAHNNSSLFIRNVLAPTTPASGICTYTGDISQATWSAGVLDLAFGGTTYQPAFLVGNQIVTQANQDMLQTETSRIIVTGAITQITDLNGDDIPTMLSNMCSNHDTAACKAGQQASALFAAGQPVNPFSTEETTAIEPSDGTTASYSPISITIVDSATIGIIRNYFEQQNQLLPGSALGSTNTVELLTYTKAEGVTSGNDAEESNTFEFPVTLCFGCLAGNLEQYSASTIGYCLAATAPNASATGVCISGQDVPSFLPAIPDLTLPACPTDGGATAVTVDGGADAG